MHPMRFLIPTVLTLLGAHSAMAGEVQFPDTVKASLVFRADFDAARRYPRILKVFLRLENAHDTDVSWVANGKNGIEAELLDATGNAVLPGPQVASFLSNAEAYLLPYGSHLEWLISHGGVSLMGDAKDKYALIVGTQGWLVPVETSGTYSLRIRLRGVPWTRTVEGAAAPRLLLDLLPTKLEVPLAPK